MAEEEKVHSVVSDEVKIECDIPVPLRKKYVKWADLLKEMKEGDSVLLPIPKCQSFRHSARGSDYRIVTRMVSPTHMRGWKIKRGNELTD